MDKIIPDLAEKTTIENEDMVPVDSGTETFFAKQSTLKNFYNGTMPSDISALQSLISILVPVGSQVVYWGTTAPSGWVMARGGSIGNASSGGTARANADTLELFKLLWSNPYIETQTSGGVTTTKGSTSTDDFNSNKRIVLPNMDNLFLRGASGAARNIGGVNYPNVNQGQFQADMMQGHYHYENGHNHISAVNIYGAGNHLGSNDRRYSGGGGDWFGLGWSNPFYTSWSYTGVTSPSPDPLNGTPRTGIETLSLIHI